MLGLQAKTNICATIKENLILYCQKLSAFVVAVIKHILIAKSVSQRKPLVKEIVKFNLNLISKYIYNKQKDGFSF